MNLWPVQFEKRVIPTRVSPLLSNVAGYTLIRNTILKKNIPATQLAGIFAFVDASSHAKSGQFLDRFLLFFKLRNPQTHPNRAGKRGLILRRLSLYYRLRGCSSSNLATPVAFSGVPSQVLGSALLIIASFLAIRIRSPCL